MKHFKDIKKKLKLEDYYNPVFDCGAARFYINNKLSEDFIREFKDKVNWKYISSHQKLSEDFIREFKDRLYLPYIFEYQTLSESFTRELENYFTSRYSS